jgi:hypothetical protein
LSRWIGGWVDGACWRHQQRSGNFRQSLFGRSNEFQRMTCLIPNQAAYNRPWTSYFIGQTRRVAVVADNGRNGGPTYYATINADGSVSVGHAGGYGFQNSSAVAATPYGREPVGNNFPSPGCAYVYGPVIAAPVMSSAAILAGTPPTDWTVTGSYYTDDCAGGGL